MVSGKKKKKPLSCKLATYSALSPSLCFSTPFSSLYLIGLFLGVFFGLWVLCFRLFLGILRYIGVFSLVFSWFRLFSFVFIYFWLFSSVFGWEIVPISSEKSTCMRDIFPSSPFLLHISHYCPYFISIFCVFVGVFE